MKDKKLVYYIVIATVIFIDCVVGAYFVFSRVNLAQMQTDLRSAMDTSLAAVNPDRVEGIDGSPEDSNNVDYLRVRDQINRLAKADFFKDINALYVMRRTPDGIIFLADSVPQGSPQYVPLGTKYINPPTDLLKVFETGESIFVGPYTDEYGTFFSYFSPIKNFIDGHQVGVLGVDIDYAPYSRKIYVQYINIFVLFLLSYIAAIILILYFRSRAIYREASMMQEERYRLLYTSSADAIMTIEPPTWKLTAGNPAAVRIFNMKDEKMLTSFTPAGLSPEKQPDGNLSSEKAQWMIEKAMKEGKNAFEWTFKRYQGEDFPGTVLLTRIKEGNREFLQSTVRDITEEKKIDRAKTEFVSLASHQLKTPVGAVQWLSEMLLSGDFGDLNGKEKEAISEIYRLNKNMTELVNAFLNVSRIELGTFIIDPTEVDYTSVCDDVLSELKEKIIAKGHTITKEYQKNLPKLMADQKLLRVIFQNLLSNAVKYTGANGKIGVKIYTDANEVHIEVRNNGIPISAEEKGKLFGRMYRATGAREMDPDGNGLGLYLLKSIVDAAQGRVWFESEPGKDTVFFVAFPLPGMKKKEGIKRLDLS